MTETVSNTADAQATGLTWVAVDMLRPHPNNPRLVTREDVVDGIAANLEGGFDPAHALIVRDVGDAYEIISGHHRKAAAEKAGLSHVPCWVRDMDDEEAYMALATANSQGELSPLEIGMHALGLTFDKRGKGAEGGGLKGYADSVGRAASKITEYRQAAKVATSISSDIGINSVQDKYAHLAAIHALPESCWQATVEAMLAGEWSAKDTSNRCAQVSEALGSMPEWADLDAQTVCKSCLASPTKAKQWARAFERVQSLSDKLPEVATIYHLEPSGEKKEQDERGYELHKPVAQEYRAREAFQSRINLLPSITAESADSEYRKIIEYIDAASEASEKWVPTMTEEEAEEARKRKAELNAAKVRELYTPQVIQGDALSELRSLSSDCFDLICIDPPYNIGKDDWDSLGNGREFADWAEEWLRECYRVLKPSGAIYVFGVNRMLSHVQHRMDEIGFHFKNWITWDTIQGSGSGMWVNRSESILYYAKTESPYEDPDSVKLERHEENVREYKGKTYQFKNPSNIWRFPCVDDKHPERTSHPTQKPVELIERIVKASSPAEGLVLDCFMGSGTTGVACMQNKRRCVGIEMDAEYIEIAKDRFSRCEVPE